MFLAIRELRFAWVRFTLVGAVISLIAVLMVMLSGFSEGLVRDGVSGLQQLPVTSFAFAEGVHTDSAFSRSVVDRDAVQKWAAQPGVEHAAPFGNALVNARSDAHVDIDLALFGVEPDSFLAPAVSEGERLGAADGIVVSRTAIEKGLKIGDALTVDRVGTRLKVVGALGGQHTYGHVDVAYVPLPVWQQIRSGVKPGDPVPEHVHREITAVAVRTGDADMDLAAGDTAAGTKSLALKKSFDASPGYSAETLTLTMIQVFLYAISALVVGAFFTVWTIQRRQELAVLRAMGASTGYLLRDALTQALIILVLAVLVGLGAGVVLGSLMGSAVPFSMTAAAIGSAAALLVVLGLAGAAAAIIRIAAVDPLVALGGSR
ncbi:ABC transporter permease [Nocardia arthritidis]|uniref:ABC transporter permease n=1 Tax=Nocardia arthritidis TaxID=228602 RepID=UPI0007A5358B|nr:ABC transporter permease [Nocardia arthritidis]